MRNPNQVGLVIKIPKRNRDAKKGLPKRVNNTIRKLHFSQYKAGRVREMNKAKRIVKDALRSSNPNKIALQQAKKSPGTISFVEKLLIKKHLI